MNDLDIPKFKFWDHLDAHVEDTSVKIPTDEHIISELGDWFESLFGDDGPEFDLGINWVDPVNAENDDDFRELIQWLIRYVLIIGGFKYVVQKLHEVKRDEKIHDRIKQLEKMIASHQEKRCKIETKNSGELYPS